MITMVTVNTWQYAGYIMLIYVAAIQGISKSVMEAAEVDGARYWTRILKIQMTSVGVADTAKRFTPKIDAKHSINSMKVDENSGILLAVNAEAKRMEKPAPFIAAPKPLPLNPRDYMSQEILAAGSSAKMAELHNSMDQKPEIQK